MNSLAVQNYFADSFSFIKTRLLYCACEAPLGSGRPVAVADDRGDNRLRLVIVGSLAPAKRQEDAIRAVAILSRRGIKTRLTIVGSGDELHVAGLHRLVENVEAGASVDFVGQTNDPFPHYRSADVALICAVGEAFGRVTIEAMKMGLPVIGARGDGTSELIFDDVNGLSYDARNADDLANKIERLDRDRPYISKLGDTARSWARDIFTLPKYTAELLEICREALDSPSERQSAPIPSTDRQAPLRKQDAGLDRHEVP